MASMLRIAEYRILEIALTIVCGCLTTFPKFMGYCDDKFRSWRSSHSRKTLAPPSEPDQAGERGEDYVELYDRSNKYGSQASMDQSVRTQVSSDQQGHSEKGWKTETTKVGSNVPESFV